MSHNQCGECIKIPQKNIHLVYNIGVAKIDYTQNIGLLPWSTRLSSAISDAYLETQKKNILNFPADYTGLSAEYYWRAFLEKKIVTPASFFTSLLFSFDGFFKANLGTGTVIGTCGVILSLYFWISGEKNEDLGYVAGYLGGVHRYNHNSHT